MQVTSNLRSSVVGLLCPFRLPAPLVTSSGTITASTTGETLSVRDFDDASTWPLALEAGLWQMQGDTDADDSDYAQLAFDFDVAAITFLYGGTLDGAFTAQVFDANLTLLDSFVDTNTNSDVPGGPITLTGDGIRYFRFGDFPSQQEVSSIIDNVEISTAAVPEPATLSLLGLGLAGAAVRRFKKRR